MATAQKTTSRPLVIVESPNKVKTISKILGDAFVVRASVGHFADIPATKKGIDIANDFHMEYSLTKKGVDIIAGLRKDLASASELILATDDDREGEMIAALLVEFLQPTVPVSRIVFHAITANEVLGSLENRREVNEALVEAARTRRALDHLVGFQVSPVLWSKVRQNLSAGRVQSPALRLVVEREFEREAFVETTYCGVEAELEIEATVKASLRSIDGVPVAGSKDIDEHGAVTPPAQLLLLTEAQRVVSGLGNRPLVVTDTKTERYTRKPRRPYITSDLLQDAVSRLKIGSKMAMSIMNQLHEKGLISYPRTDSPSLSPWITQAAREQAIALFGPNSVPAKPNLYFAKRQNAQEAHEAIRPADMTKRSPSGLTAPQAAIYDMVWRRTVASQMVNTTGTTVTITLEGVSTQQVCVFTASGTTITDPGHRAVFTSTDDDEPTPLATFTTGDEVGVRALEIEEHTTRPPARFTEASLIRALEEREIGRPSTYASIIDSLRNEYLWSKRGDQALIPTITGIAVAQFLNICFVNLVDYQFTKQMEEHLDTIVDGKETFLNVLTRFYAKGDGQWPSLLATIATATKEYDPATHSVRNIGVHPETGDSIVVKSGRAVGGRVAKKGTRKTGRGVRSTGSPYIKCGNRNVPVPDTTEWADLTIDFALALLNAPKIEPRVLGEVDGHEVVARTGPYGPYISTTGRNISLPTQFDIETVELQDVAELFKFPRSLGTDEATGEEIVVKLGRYGAFIERGKDRRTLDSIEQAALLTLTDAHAILAIEKKKPKRSSPKGRQ